MYPLLEDYHSKEAPVRFYLVSVIDGLKSDPIRVAFIFFNHSHCSIGNGAGNGHEETSQHYSGADS